MTATFEHFVHVGEEMFRLTAMTRSLHESLGRTLSHHIERSFVGASDSVIDLSFRASRCGGDLHVSIHDPAARRESRHQFGAWNRVQEHDSRIYYKVVLPLITLAMSWRGFARLHAASLWSEDIGLVLALGPSGAGKTTLALNWMLEGGVVLGDDVTFIRAKGIDIECVGLRRSFNLAPDTIRRHRTLPRIEQAAAYLPGREKVAYDAWSLLRAPQIRGLRGKPIVLLSEIDPAASVSTLGRAGQAELRTAAQDALSVSPDDPIAASLPSNTRALEQLENGTTFHTRWGADVFNGRTSYIGFLRTAVQRWLHA